MTCFRCLQASLCFFFSFASYLSAYDVGLLIMATGKYGAFVHPLVESAKLHFLSKHHVTYYVFTDQKLSPQKDVVYIYQEKLGWPLDTMMRFRIYDAHRDLFENQDYLYASDVDMLFVAEVGDEILSDRVATLSPGFSPGSPYPRMRGSYEVNSLSTACVEDDEGDYYFAGGFYGGNTQEFLNIAKTNADNIDCDLQHNIIAVWHDESHWNRYCIDHPPTLILSPSYCYPEKWKIPYQKKLLALDKNHEECRRN